jgi:hypothetical protein
VVCAAFTHTDLDGWPVVLAEAARVVQPGGSVAYVGTHPCFPHATARYPGDAPPELFAGDRQTAGWSFSGPGRRPGPRRRVGAFHLPLAELLNAFADAGLRLETLSEPGPQDYPRLLAARARRPEWRSQTTVEFVQVLDRAYPGYRHANRHGKREKRHAKRHFCVTKMAEPSRGGEKASRDPTGR